MKERRAGEVKGITGLDCIACNEPSWYQARSQTNQLQGRGASMLNFCRPGEWAKGRGPSLLVNFLFKGSKV